MKLHFRVAAGLVAGCAVFLSGAGCGQDEDGAAQPLGVRLQFLTDEGLSTTIPDSLFGGFLNICIAPVDGDCTLLSSFVPIGRPDGADPGERGLFDPSADLDDDGRPEYAVTGLPYETDLKVEVKAVMFPGPDEVPLYSAKFLGLRLAKGERRFLTVTLTPTNQFSTFDPTVLQAPEGFAGGRLGASVTGLPDGRVLIAGGFNSAVPLTLANCRAHVPDVADGSVCFYLMATPKAYVLVPGSGRIYELRSPLGEPTGRAFHSAVALPDGRVLLAGGVDAAVLVFTPLPDTDGWFPELVPVSPRVEAKGMLTTFEWFDPNLNALAENPNRDGDPGRGGFAGLGSLATPRLFSVAALWPTSDPLAPPRVVLLGGVDPSPPPATRPSMTWENWDSSTGLSELSTGSLLKPRGKAGVARMHYDDTPELWIVGGAPTAANDTDVFTIWQAGATAGSPFGGGTSHADKNFLLPSITPLGNAVAPRVHLVAGSLGPRCERIDGTGEYRPTYDATTGLWWCPPSVAPPYVINRATATTRLDPISGWDPASDAPHILGAAVTLGDGSALVVGGANGFDFVATRAAHRVIWDESAMTARKDPALPPTAYPVAVLFPAGTATATGDAVFFGGVSVTLTRSPAIQLSDAVVIYNQE